MCNACENTWTCVWHLLLIVFGNTWHVLRHLGLKPGIMIIQSILMNLTLDRSAASHNLHTSPAYSVCSDISSISLPPPLYLCCSTVTLHCSCSTVTLHCSCPLPGHILSVPHRVPSQAPHLALSVCHRVCDTSSVVRLPSCVWHIQCCQSAIVCVTHLALSDCHRVCDTSSVVSLPSCVWHI